MRLFDLHCDTLTVGVRSGKAPHCLSATPFEERTRLYAAFLPDGLSLPQAVARYEAQIAVAARWHAECPDAFRLGDTALLSVENGGALHGIPTLTERFAADGIRAVGLTWNGDNAWGSGCGGTPDRALTTVGAEAVRCFERHRITVDVSHLNEAGFWQVARMASRPFIATHSNAAAVTPHPRNLTDEQFAVIRDGGGLVGLNVYPPFLGGNSPQAFCRHVDHFLALGGDKTVCIGSDLDGFDTPPIGMAYLATLYEFMAVQGYGTQLIDDIFYGNARRFFDRTMI